MSVELKPQGTVISYNTPLYLLTCREYYSKHSLIMNETKVHLLSSDSFQLFSKCHVCAHSNVNCKTSGLKFCAFTATRYNISHISLATYWFICPVELHLRPKVSTPECQTGFCIHLMKNSKRNVTASAVLRMRFPSKVQPGACPEEMSREMFHVGISQCLKI